jgi:pimeloyl-ACP methyl ester carboxylesterase
VTLEGGVAGTLRRPDGATASSPAPAVVMLHGFGSSKDEVGNMYARLADALAAQGVGSLRIDFRGFGKSDGDTGFSTMAGQVEDAEAAYAYLAGLDWVDPQRVGVIGFSLGGGVAMITAGTHPEWFGSLVTWSSVGDMLADITASVGEEAVATAAEKGVVGMDLGWRTMVLKQAFFDSLDDYDLSALIAQYPGAYLAIAGDQDFSAAYAPGFVETAVAEPKELWIVEGGDHIFQTLTEDLTMSDAVIARTADWFAQTLGGE